MEFYVNELSLSGQFESMAEFVDNCGDFIGILKVVEELGLKVSKHSELYKRKITSQETFHDLSKFKRNDISRDKVRKFKSLLLKLSQSPPFWDLQEKVEYNKYFWNGQDVSRNSIGQAIAAEGALISFLHNAFIDKELEVFSEPLGLVYNVHSIAQTKYLSDVLENVLQRHTYMNIRYKKSRLNTEYLDEKYGCKSLEKEEFLDLVQALDRFVNHESWNSLLEDKSLNYKKYQPSKKRDWFSESKYSNKDIDKFRAGSTFVLRCFGYRESEKFFLLRIERDHKISDNG